MASHMPVNHSLRPLYRALALVAGLFVLAFGIAGFLATQGDPIFEPGAERALGLRTNPALSYACIAAGALVLVATLIGRNLDRFVNLYVGTLFLIAGTAMMPLMGGDSNVLNFTMVTCIAAYAVGSVLLTAGLYGKTARA
jgi:hypothetical protein